MATWTPRMTIVRHLGPFTLEVLEEGGCWMWNVLGMGLTAPPMYHGAEWTESSARRAALQAAARLLEDWRAEAGRALEREEAR